MFKTSEWVSVGHPDKMADAISSYILDRYLEHDKNTRFALECQIKDKNVTLGGEITSMAYFPENRLVDFVKEAVRAIGYTKEYQDIWGYENTICADSLRVNCYINGQSPDIAQGVDGFAGWGDQGIFWGMAVKNPETEYMPEDWYLARKIGLRLFHSHCGGLDIKTQVSLKNNTIDEIVIAIPLLESHSKDFIKDQVLACCAVDEKKIIINGTGRFVKHGPVGDCGTTGRKLAVDFYGGNCKLGGGCPWTKDWTKADLTLNVFARKLALDFLLDGKDFTEVHCSLSCRIGSRDVRVTYYDGNMRELGTQELNTDPAILAAGLRLTMPQFFSASGNGVFSFVPVR